MRSRGRGTRHGQSGSTLLPGVLLIFGLAGCGDDSTGPETGRAEAFVGDDPGSAATMALLAGEPADGSSGASLTFTGTAAGDFQASVSADGNTWIDLGSPNGITVQLQSSGKGTTVHGAQTVPAATYARARLILRDVEITVNAGSQVDGVTLETDAKLDLALDEELVLEREVGPVTATVDSGIEVLFDLNAEAWLTAEAVTTGTLSESQVAASVTAAAASR